MAKKPPAAADVGPPKLIGLIRVSTGKQEESGLGLDAQEIAIEKYRQSVGGVLLRTYTEVESGKHLDIEGRPKLRMAANDALFSNATLVIAKIDRMVRSIPVMGFLEKIGVKYVACDNPHANKLTKDILVVVASAEAVQISNRTREALAAYKAGRRVSRRIREMYPAGVPADVVEATAGKLGASLPQCRNLKGEAQAKGTVAAAEARTRSAASAYSHLVPTMLQLRGEGLSMRAIADRLNEMGHRTRQGCSWNYGQVARILARPKSAT
jgi:DNA invertase Pin-like site-specific DNA recombinase